MICLALATILIANELATTIYAISTGVWHYSWALPLNLCDAALFAVAISLIYPVGWIWEIAFFWVIAGSIPAVITPDLPVSFPNPFYILFFTAHGGAIIALFYLVTKKDMNISFYSVKRCWVITHFYVFFILLFNIAFETNYLFLLAKPDQFSPIDFFGPWPYYLVGLDIYFTLFLFISYALYEMLIYNRH